MIVDALVYHHAYDDVHWQTERASLGAYVPISRPMVILDQDTRLMSPSDAFFATVFAKFDTNKDKRRDAGEVCVIVLSE